MWKALEWVRLNHAQRNTMAKAAENIGTLATGSVIVQGIFETTRLTERSIIEGIIAALLCYLAAIWLRRKEA